MIPVDKSGFQSVTCSHTWPIMDGRTRPDAYASARVSKCLRLKHVGWVSTVVHVSGTIGGTLHSDRGE